MAGEMESVIAGAIADAGLSESSDSGAADTGNEADTDTDTGSDNSEDTGAEGSAEAAEGEGDSAEAEADTSEDNSGQEDGQDGEEAEAEAGADGKAGKKPVEKPVEEEKDQLTKDLEELGLKAPKPGERENRLPHSRVRRIAENYGKKVEARFTAQLDTVTRQARSLAKKAAVVDNVDKLIETDPDRYMTILSTIHPGKFDKYLSNAAGAGGGKADKGAPKTPQSVAELGPEPQPDVEFADKSRGYSPEQHAKLMKWTRDVAKAEAKEEALAEMEARMEKKYGTMAKSFEERQALNAEIPRVRAEIAAIHETWGKELVDKHENEIVAMMEEHPGMSTTEATARVLVPKVRADRNKVRSAVIKDQKSRTAAAAKVVPTGTANKESADEGSIEDVIRRSVATLRR